jgi:hypothetical protein
MSVPQKEGPASMLRAMFASVGSLLSVVDRMRGKTAAEAPTDAETPAPAATAAPAAPAEPQPAEPATVAAETVTPETVVAETTAEPAPAAEPATVVAETVTPETVTPETVTPETVAPEATAALPLANYDELSVASLRARLRGLSVASLAQLVEYEKDHAARADVISMFERRIAKIEAEA